MIRRFGIELILWC